MSLAPIPLNRLQNPDPDHPFGSLLVVLTAVHAFIHATFILK